MNMMGKEYKYINAEYIGRVLDFAEKLNNGKPTTAVDRFSYRAFAYAVQLYGYNGFPQVVPDQKFDAVPSTTLYRGVKDTEHNANLLCDYDYHYGFGTWGDGIYSITERPIAFHYTKKSPLSAENTESEEELNQRIMTFKVDPRTKFVNLNKIFQQVRLAGPARLLCLPEVRELFKFSHTLSKERENLLNQLLTSNISLAALFIGYEGLKYFGDADEETDVLLNRGKMIVSESEFRRVCALSRKYKDGTIDFAQKYANPEVEFLNE